MTKILVNPVNVDIVSLGSLYFLNSRMIVTLAQRYSPLDFRSESHC